MWFYIVPMNCLKLVNPDILSTGRNIVKWSNETPEELSLGFKCTKEICLSSEDSDTQISALPQQKHVNTCFPKHLGVFSKCLYISRKELSEQRWLYFTEHTGSVSVEWGDGRRTCS